MQENGTECDAVLNSTVEFVKRVRSTFFEAQLSVAAAKQATAASLMKASQKSGRAFGTSEVLVYYVNKHRMLCAQFELFIGVRVAF